MAAKLLHALADDNPDLQKQIGCMTGIFQMFDRHQVLTGRRLSYKRLPQGNSCYNNGSSERESFSGYHWHSVAEMSSDKGLNEKHRISTESSRASSSSSCSCSFSSLDCNKIAQQEGSSFDRIIFPETPSRNPVITEPSTSSHLRRQSLDLRDVIKDSMYREARGLSVKTTAKEDAMGHEVKHKESPRPLQFSKSEDGSYGVENMGKQNVPAELKESLRVLAKLREAPWYYNETRERPRSSYELKDGSWHTILKDAPRFSYDGRERNLLSFESRATIKSTPKMKELPRLSLDSRVVSMQSSNFDAKSNYLPRDFHMGGNSNNSGYHVQQPLGTQNRPPSVVAKLMGLETFPDSASTSYSQLCLTKSSLVPDGDSFSRSLKPNQPGTPPCIPKSPRSSLKEPASPRWKNPDLVMNTVSKLPIKTAPWKPLDGIRGSRKPTLKPAKVPERTSNSFPSVYSEIENRLKDIKFTQSGKDLRALKQILEAMQAKGLFERSKEEHGSNFVVQREYGPKCTDPNQKPRLLNQRNQQGNNLCASIAKGSSFSRTYDSPIVIMKPAKLVKKSCVPSSLVIPIDGISGLHKIPSSECAAAKRGSVKNRTGKGQSPRNSHKDSVNSCDKKNNVKNTKSTQPLTKSQHLPKESNTSSAKNSGSVSPRQQQKKLEFEKRSCPPTHPSDSCKPRRQSNKQSTESGSPGGKNRPRAPKSPQDYQLSQISNESRTSSHQGDDTSLQSDNTPVVDSKTDMEGDERLTDINGGESPSMKVINYLASGSLKEQKYGSIFEEDGTLAEVAAVAPEHPSPVSVLDTSIYRDEALSPIRQIPKLPKGDGVQDSSDPQSEDPWNTADNFQSNNIGSGPTSEINRKKLQSIENLVQKLRRLNSTYNEASMDYIASLCENTNPDHRYISEILLAAGLLLRDLGTDLSTFQLHPSGYPINPELFFVLEQTRTSNLLFKEECSPAKTSHSKTNPEKFHRKLIFDAVNEILVKKLALVGPSPDPWLKSDKLAKRTPSAQKLLKELCSEMEQQQTKKSECCLEEEADGLKTILWDDVIHRSESWINFQSEVSGLVLDVERSIFKELVDEIVIGEAGGSRSKPSRGRQLFAK